LQEQLENETFREVDHFQPEISDEQSNIYFYNAKIKPLFKRVNHSQHEIPNIYFYNKKIKPLFKGVLEMKYKVFSKPLLHIEL